MAKRKRSTDEILMNGNGIPKCEQEDESLPLPGAHYEDEPDPTPNDTALNQNVDEEQTFQHKNREDLLADLTVSDSDDADDDNDEIEFKSPLDLIEYRLKSCHTAALSFCKIMLKEKKITIENFADKVNTKYKEYADDCKSNPTRFGSVQLFKAANVHRVPDGRSNTCHLCPSPIHFWTKAIYTRHIQLMHIVTGPGFMCMDKDCNFGNNDKPYEAESRTDIREHWKAKHNLSTMPIIYAARLDDNLDELYWNHRYLDIF